MSSAPAVTAFHDIPAYSGPGAIEGVHFRAAGSALGVSAWGMNVIEIDAGATGYPEHAHEEDGQEEVYVVLAGSGAIHTAGGDADVAQGDMLRIGPDVRRRFTAGPDGLALLALGGTPGQVYAPGMGG